MCVTQRQTHFLPASQPATQSVFAVYVFHLFISFNGREKCQWCCETVLFSFQSFFLAVNFSHFLGNLTQEAKITSKSTASQSDNARKTRNKTKNLIENERRDISTAIGGN